MPPAKRSSKPTVTEIYQHPEADSPMRPEVGTQAQFKKKKPPQKYRYDSSLSPALEWDGQNPARERGEALIARRSSAGSRSTKAWTAPRWDRSCALRTQRRSAQRSVVSRGRATPLLAECVSSRGRAARGPGVPSTLRHPRPRLSPER